MLLPSNMAAMTSYQNALLSEESSRDRGVLLSQITRIHSDYCTVRSTNEKNDRFYVCYELTLLR